MNVNTSYIVGSDSGALSQPTPSLKRMSISLPADIAEMLEVLTSHQGISQNEAIRKAIATEAYVYKERMQGSKVLLQKSDGEIREVVFR
ncbi:ribbon-helix-helix protein, CopG family [Cyanobacteria bacterium FACHB-63]|nr:ribbon-helix-helix protein, CopG family [Cyanobacteria bacterium FACHB-63]